MKLTVRSILVTVVLLVLGVIPALAMASGRPANAGSASQSKSHVPSTVVGTSASPAKQAKAYGFYCQSESKKHVAGTPGTPFSACVTAAAKATSATLHGAKKNCGTESKKHVAGTPGTPFSACVVAAAKTVSSTSSSTSTSTSPSFAQAKRAAIKACSTESKKHVAGTPGTPFSACVTAAAKTATKSSVSPAKACSTESRKHVAGTPGTPYSACVKGAAQAVRKTI